MSLWWIYPWLPLILLGAFGISVAVRLRRNIARVKETGLPYKIIRTWVGIVVNMWLTLRSLAIGNYHPAWLTTFWLILPVLRHLPTSWTESWIEWVGFALS